MGEAACGRTVACGYFPILYVRSPAAFLDDSIIPPPLLPRMLTKPSTVCACHFVTAMISASIAPLARFNSAMTSAFLLARSALGREKQQGNSSDIVLRLHQADIGGNWRVRVLFYVPDKTGVSTTDAFHTTQPVAARPKTCTKSARWRFTSLRHHQRASDSRKFQPGHHLKLHVQLFSGLNVDLLGCPSQYCGHLGIPVGNVFLRSESDKKIIT